MVAVLSRRARESIAEVIRSRRLRESFDNPEAAVLQPGLELVFLLIEWLSCRIVIYRPRFLQRQFLNAGFHDAKDALADTTSASSASS